MPLSVSNCLVIPRESLVFWRKIRKIQGALGLSSIKLCELLEISVQDFNDLRQSHQVLKINSLSPFCEKLVLSLDHLLEKEIDFDLLFRNYYGLEPRIPVNYRRAAYGNLKTFKAMVTYLNQTRGRQFTSVVLSAFQLEDRNLLQPDTKVNINFYDDFTKQLYRHGVSEEEFRRMGSTACYENLRQANLPRLGNRYQRLSPIERSLRVILDVADRNHIYKIEKLTSNLAFVSARPSEEVQDVLKKGIIGNKYTDIVKEGLFSSVPICFGEKVRLKATLVQSLHSGSKQSLYKIDVL